MLSDIHLNFLSNRILEIGSALFTNTSNATFKLPTSVISVLTVDEAGNILFFLHNPDLFIDESDKEFPARLDFYRKGKPFFLQVSGRALVITSRDEINALLDKMPEHRVNIFSRVMLVKVRIEQAACYEQRERTVSRLESWWHAICQRLLQEKPSYRPYKLHPVVLA